MEQWLAAEPKAARSDLVHLDSRRSGLQRPGLVRDDRGEQAPRSSRFVTSPYAIVTFYLGLNLLTHLDEDRERTEALVTRLQALAPLLG